MINKLIRGGLMPAALACAVAGCAGGGTTTPAATSAGNASNAAPSSAAKFERYRAGVEAAARKSVPAGYQLSVGSTYLTKDGRIFTAAAAVLQSADKIAFRAGARTLVYGRMDVTEVPNTYFETHRAGRTPSYLGGCGPDGCIGGGGGGDPTPAPDPTPPPDSYPTYSDVTSPSASSIGAQRVSCTQSFSTNGYPGAKMSYTYFNGNVWALDYRPGYPQYIGTDQEYKTVEVDLVDGSKQRVVTQPYYVGTGGVTESTLIYTGGPLSTVKYAQITITDYAVDSINTISGLATVTCTNDSSLPITATAPVVTGPTDPPGNGWANPWYSPQPTY